MVSPRITGDAQRRSATDIGGTTKEVKPNAGSNHSKWAKKNTKVDPECTIDHILCNVHTVKNKWYSVRFYGYLAFFNTNKPGLSILSHCITRNWRYRGKNGWGNYQDSRAQRIRREDAKTWRK